MIAAEHIAGGQKAMEAGINYAAHVMPGLAKAKTTQVIFAIKIRRNSLTHLETLPFQGGESHTSANCGIYATVGGAT